MCGIKAQWYLSVNTDTYLTTLLYIFTLLLEYIDLFAILTWINTSYILLAFLFLVPLCLICRLAEACLYIHTKHNYQLVLVVRSPGWQCRKHRNHSIYENKNAIRLADSVRKPIPNRYVNHLIIHSNKQFLKFEADSY